MKKIVLATMMAFMLAGCFGAKKIKGVGTFPPPPVPIGTPIEPLKTIPTN